MLVFFNKEFEFEFKEIDNKIILILLISKILLVIILQ